jgi:S1-C subfamily serine protease
LAYDGKAVNNPDDFRNEVATAPIGDTITLSILRNGTPLDVKIKVSSDQEHGRALLSSVAERFGVEVKPVGQKDAKKYGLDTRGVLVSRVETKGVFGKAGVEPGDIILQLNQKDLAGPEDFGEVLSLTPPEKKVILTVVDHRSQRASVVQLTAP